MGGDDLKDRVQLVDVLDVHGEDDLGAEVTVVVDVIKRDIALLVKLVKQRGPLYDS